MLYFTSLSDSIACVSAFLLLHLLSQDWVLHTSGQHSKEEGGEEGAEAEGHPGDGVGQHNLLPLPVHRLHNLIGQDWRAHAVGQLLSDNCEKTNKFRFVRVPQRNDIPSEKLLTIFSTAESKQSPSYLFPMNWNTFVMIFHTSLPLQSLPFQLVYSHAARVFGLGAGPSAGGGSEALMKVWLMVLTTIPYSSTSARRQSKKACAACLDAASEGCQHTYTHILIIAHKRGVTLP